MRSWAQGEVRVCELFMNATLPGFVVGRAGGRASVVLGLLAAGKRGGGGWDGTGARKSAEESSAEMASSPAVGGAVWLGAKADVALLV